MELQHNDASFRFCVATNRIAYFVEVLFFYFIYLAQRVKLEECLLSKENVDINGKIVELHDTRLSNGKNISEYITIECEDEKDGLSISYSINNSMSISSKYVDPQIAKREYDKVEQYEKILVSSTLSTVIIIFEQFLAKIYEGLILINPQKYFENQKIEISSIFNKSLKDIIIESVRREVESNMFDSLKTLERISQKENIDINRYVNIQDEFEEIYYRRNLFIHNNGIVNNLYLTNIKDKYKDKCEIGKEITTDDLYLRNAINVLLKIVCTFFFEIQFSYNPNYAKWNSSLGNIAFDLLQKKNYSVAEHIYYIMSSCKAFCFKDKAMYRINYINALKQQGKTDKVQKEIKELDVSIATDDYQIAKLCLEGKNKEVYEALSKSYPDSFTAEHIRDWPLFINFRETEYYTTFVKEHTEDFGMFVFEFDKTTMEEKGIEE